MESDSANVPNARFTQSDHVRIAQINQVRAAQERIAQRNFKYDTTRTEEEKLANMNKNLNNLANNLPEPPASPDSVEEQPLTSPSNASQSVSMEQDALVRKIAKLE